MFKLCPRSSDADADAAKRDWRDFWDTFFCPNEFAMPPQVRDLPACNCKPIELDTDDDDSVSRFLCENEYVMQQAATTAKPLAVG